MRRRKKLKISKESLSERMANSATVIRGKEYIGIVNGNTITAVEVKEILNDGFVASVVGDPNGLPITYPMIPFVEVKKDLEKVIIQKLDELAGKKKPTDKSQPGNIINHNFKKN